MGQACPETLLLAKYANSQGQANGFCQRVEDGETSAGSQKPLARTGNRHAEQALEENGALFMDLSNLPKPGASLCSKGACKVNAAKSAPSVHFLFCIFARKTIDFQSALSIVKGICRMFPSCFRQNKRKHYCNQYQFTILFFSDCACKGQQQRFFLHRPVPCFSRDFPGFPESQE